MQGRQRVQRMGRRLRVCPGICGRPCGRPATYRAPSTGKRRARADHPLCERCYAAQFELL